MSSRQKGVVRVGGLLVALTAVVATGACLDRELKPLNPCVISGVANEVQATNIEKVDVLFMVDNSDSMAEEQVSLAQEFPRLAGVLASGDMQYDPSTGSGDGEQEFPPVKSLRVGVISSELSIGNRAVRTCNDDPDDGILIGETRVATDDPACMASYSPPWLQFDAPADGNPDPNEVEAFADNFACIGRLGTGGCGFEQQLDAVLKALTPRNADVIGDPDADPSKIAPFATGAGHGDGANEGFLRPDSLLALIVVTDEDDCSAHDLEIFNPDSDTYSGVLNLRCIENKEALYPVERYVKGFMALRDNPQLLVYAAITGVPADLVSNPNNINYEAILDDSRMQEQVDPDEGDRLVPACSVPGRGVAFPGRRITQVAQRLERQGSNGIVQSICQENFTGALDAIIGKIAEALGGTCLPRELNLTSQGEVECQVVEVLPNDGDFTRCEDLESLGRNPDPVRIEERETEDGTVTQHEVCEVQQIPRCLGGGDNCVSADGRIPDQRGWYYDDFSDDVTQNCPAGQTQRIAFTAGAEPKTGVLVRLECLQTVQVGGDEEVGLGTPCRSEPEICARSTAFDGLICEQTSGTCQLPCGSNADCLAQNLGGYVCDTTQQAGEWQHGGDAAAICVNPTCGGGSQSSM